MSIWVGIEVVACFLLLIAKRRIGFLCYQVAIAGVYLLALAMEQTLDYTMSVYFAFAVLPFVRYFGCPNVATLFPVLYFCFWTLTSVFLNGAVAVLSTLIIHYLGPLVLVYVYSHIPATEILPASMRDGGSSVSYVKKAVLLALVIETFIGILAMSMSSTGRLMLNYQCVSGCLSCVCVMLLGVVGRNGGNLPFVLLMGSVAVFWSIASGTRGYIVLSIVMFAVVCFNTLGSKKAIAVALLFCALLLICEVVLPNGIAGTFLAERFSDSTGRRGVENRWAVNMLLGQGLLRDFFGFGLGTTLGTQPYAASAFFGVGASSYEYSAIMEASNLHNFWYSCILAVGFIGLVLYVIPLASFARNRLTGGGIPRETKLSIACFFAAYAFVLWFRWTATGGILEAGMVAFFLAATSCQKDTTS